jgi:hypothetical protein
MQQGVPYFTKVLHEHRVTPLIMTIRHVSSAQVYSVILAYIVMPHGRIIRTSLAH